MCSDTALGRHSWGTNGGKICTANKPWHSQHCTELIPVGSFEWRGIWHCGHVTRNQEPPGAVRVACSAFAVAAGAASIVRREHACILYCIR